MQQRQQQQHQSQRIFTASEVASFEYCPLAWWHEQYEPLAQADTEELFAEMVALEHEHSQQATALPEYQVIEQLLLRRGAFDEGRQQHAEHAEAVAEVEEERIAIPRSDGYMRRLAILAALLLLLALALIALSYILIIR